MIRIGAIGLLGILALIAAYFRFFVTRVTYSDDATVALFSSASPRWDSALWTVTDLEPSGILIFSDENTLPFEPVLNLMLSDGLWVAIVLLLLCIACVFSPRVTR